MWWFIGLIVLVVIGVGVGFYFVGKKEVKPEVKPGDCSTGTCDPPPCVDCEKK